MHRGEYLAHQQRNDSKQRYASNRQQHALRNDFAALAWFACTEVLRHQGVRVSQHTIEQGVTKIARDTAAQSGSHVGRPELRQEIAVGKNHEREGALRDDHWNRHAQQGEEGLSIEMQAWGGHDLQYTAG